MSECCLCVVFEFGLHILSLSFSFLDECTWFWRIYSLAVRWSRSFARAPFKFVLISLAQHFSRSTSLPIILFSSFAQQECCCQCSDHFFFLFFHSIRIHLFMGYVCFVACYLTHNSNLLKNAFHCVYVRMFCGSYY